MKPIAHIRTDFPQKFGVPRAARLVPELTARVVFEPEYAMPEAFRGLEGFSHLWLIWVFSHNVEEGWSPTVRPPRLGGNERMGVFATRAPFRPNPIGLSAVEILGIERGAHGIELVVGGADLVDGTPILDVKPYVPID
ncbi:MAG TPA: tRNA (N6-threonylcarbamoyladenosine(37)-N6)-methyltransferase TrmO, partial [Actinomycetales bacterium]|nr:tRNA (N6-threonylcarbamoyladenosine(37)-N6)-methyltransferase TrmO [Actinomycetales bacterium]